jgi:hypothetical protein
VPDERAWEWLDAWLLSAIVQADAGGPQVISGDPTAAPLDGLAHVLGCGDAINHAVFNEEELEVSLPRLRAAGLVDDAYRPTAAGMALHEQASRGTRYMSDVLERLAELLRAVSLPDRLPAHGLAPGEVGRAYAQYDEWFERMERTRD